MRTWTWLILGTLMACKGTPQPTDTDDTVWPPSKPYQTDGDEGSIVMVALNWPENPRLDVYGLFADDMQGYVTGAACAAEELPCVRDMPDQLDGQVRANNRSFIPTSSRTRWVGDRISVGPVFADLIHDHDDRLLSYEGSEDQAPVGAFRLRFGGEWADYDRDAVPFSENFRLVEPILQAGERLDLSGPPIDFRWLSNLQNDVWFWVQGPSTRQFFQLQDDGHFQLDPSVLGLDPAEVVEVGLAAATRESVDVDGNRLDVLALKGNGWKGMECGQYLDVPVVNQPPSDELMEHPLFYGTSFRGIIDDGLHDYIDPDTNQFESAKLVFTFFDPTLTPLCEIEYDASDGGRTQPLITDSGAVLYESYSVALFNGKSDCGLVDPTITGFQDLRNWLEQFDWGFAIGEITELEDSLSIILGEQWDTQKDYMHGVFWTRNGLFGEEHGYGYRARLTECHLPDDRLVEPLPDDDELPVGYYFTYPYFVQPILQ